MTLINLKFSPDMEQAVIEGRKCCTTRMAQKGNVGDTFLVRDRVYRIVSILYVLADEIYEFAMLDGFSNPSDYVSRLRELYNLKSGYILTVHFFAFTGYIEVEE